MFAIPACGGLSEHVPRSPSGSLGSCMTCVTRLGLNNDYVSLQPPVSKPHNLRESYFDPVPRSFLIRERATETSPNMEQDDKRPRKQDIMDRYGWDSRIWNRFVVGRWSVAVPVARLTNTRESSEKKQKASCHTARPTGLGRRWYLLRHGGWCPKKYKRKS